MGSDNYSTPRWIMKMFEDWFDPCPLNPMPEVDGLTIDWASKTYVNPPYSNPLPWIEKAIKENKKGHTIALLLKLDCTTNYYKLLVSNGAHIIHICERVKFNGRSPPFCNMLCILEGKEQLGK